MTQVFSVKSTAEEVCASELGKNAKGKFVLITGGNCGIGFETARVLAKSGAHVTIMCRDPTKAEEAISKINDASLPVSFIRLDLSSLDSVREAAAEYKAKGIPLHILICNAGVMACPKALTKDGYELQFGVNHLGHFLLTNLLLQLLSQCGTPSDPARAVMVSSMANFLFPSPESINFEDLKAEKSYSRWESYGNSKLANIVFARELNARCKRDNLPVISMSLHPGNILDTELKRHMSTSSPNPLFEILYYVGFNWTKLALISTGYKTIPEGAATTVFVSLDPNVIPGEFYSDCQVSTKVHSKAKDEVFASKLWEVSLACVGKI